MKWKNWNFQREVELIQWKNCFSLLQLLLWCRPIRRTYFTIKSNTIFIFVNLIQDNSNLSKSPSNATGHHVYKTSYCFYMIMKHNHAQNITIFKKTAISQKYCHATFFLQQKIVILLSNPSHQHITVINKHTHTDRERESRLSQWTFGPCCIVPL